MMKKIRFTIAALLTAAVFVSCSGTDPEDASSEPPLSSEVAEQDFTGDVCTDAVYESKIADGLWQRALELQKHFDTRTTCGSSSHLQGICADDRLEYMYFSYTDVLAKLDMSTGKVVGSVGGFGKGSFGTPGGAHLGCIAYYDGKIYGSLEYKDPGKKFFVCVFDENAITSVGMDMKEMESGVDAVLLYEPTVDFRDPLGDGIVGGDGFAENEKIGGHKYGCSGIDGITFGRLPGSPEGSREYMMVAYGIYGKDAWTTDRFDNDYNIIQVYDQDELTPEKLFRFTYERGLDPDFSEQEALHAVETLFVFTGNTHYGTQNLEYERDTGNILLVTYGTKKTNYPGCSLFVVDGSATPEKTIIQAGQNAEIRNKKTAEAVKARSQYYRVDEKYPQIDLCRLKRLESAFCEEKTWGESGIFALISGTDAPANSTTGIMSLGGGYWYIADGATSVSLYRSGSDYSFNIVLK